jgi:hypothetical protein
VAQMRSADRVRKCLLFGADRTYRGHHETDANDPMQTYVGDGRLAALCSASPHEFYDALAGIRAGIVREFALEGGGERGAVHPCSLAGGMMGAPLPVVHVRSSSNALAFRRSGLSKPSLNQLYTGASRSYAACRWP